MARDTTRVSADELESQLERLPRHQLFAEIPVALRSWLLPIEWDRRRLWALDLPRRHLRVDELRWHFELPWWRQDGVWFQVTPQEFLTQPSAYREHADRVATADLSYPLHVIPRHGRWLILDGIHRLVKADLVGLDELAVSALAPQDLMEIVRRPALSRADPGDEPSGAWGDLREEPASELGVPFG